MTAFEQYPRDFGEPRNPNFVWDPILMQYVDPDIVPFDTETGLEDPSGYSDEAQFPAPLPPGNDETL